MGHTTNLVAVHRGTKASDTKLVAGVKHATHRHQQLFALIFILPLPETY